MVNYLTFIMTTTICDFSNLSGKYPPYNLHILLGLQFSYV